MELLFFYINNRIACIYTRFVKEVVIDIETEPFLYNNPVIDELVTHRGKIYGLMNLNNVLALPVIPESRVEIILLNFNGIEFGMKVGKVLNNMIVPKNRIIKPMGSEFIKEDFISYSCKVGKKNYPIISLKKVLLKDDVKKLWFKG